MKAAIRSPYCVMSTPEPAVGYRRIREVNAVDPAGLRQAGRQSWRRPPTHPDAVHQDVRALTRPAHARIGQGGVVVPKVAVTGAASRSEAGKGAHSSRRETWCHGTCRHAGFSRLPQRAGETDHRSGKVGAHHHGKLTSDGSGLGKELAGLGDEQFDVLA